MQPDLYWGSVRLAEPVIALTGLLIAGVSSYAWRRITGGKSWPAGRRWFGLFFLLMAMGSVLGAFLGHLFYYKAGFPGKYISWIFSILSQAALAQAVLEHARAHHSERWYRRLILVNASLALVAINFSGITKSFHWIEFHSAAVLLGILMPIEAGLWRRYRTEGSRLLLSALPVAVLAVVPHLLKWSPSVWFTYFDVGHLFVCGALWFILLGAEAAFRERA